MKVELTFPDEFAELIAEKVVEKIKSLLEARGPEPRTTPVHNKEIDPMRAMNDHEVALLIGKSVQSIRNHRYLGRGAPYLKVGKAVRYRRGEVLEWLETQRIEPMR